MSCNGKRTPAGGAGCVVGPRANGMASLIGGFAVVHIGNLLKSTVVGGAPPQLVAGGQISECQNDSPQYCLTPGASISDGEMDGGLLCTQSWKKLLSARCHAGLLAWSNPKSYPIHASRQTMTPRNSLPNAPRGPPPPHAANRIRGLMVWGYLTPEEKPWVTVVAAAAPIGATAAGAEAAPVADDGSSHRGGRRLASICSRSKTPKNNILKTKTFRCFLESLDPPIKMLACYDESNWSSNWPRTHPRAHTVFVKKYQNETAAIPNRQEGKKSECGSRKMQSIKCR